MSQQFDGKALHLSLKGSLRNRSSTSNRSKGKRKLHTHCCWLYCVSALILLECRTIKTSHFACSRQNGAIGTLVFLFKRLDVVLDKASTSDYTHFVVFVFICSPTTRRCIPSSSTSSHTASRESSASARHSYFICFSITVVNALRKNSSSHNFIHFFAHNRQLAFGI